MSKAELMNLEGPFKYFDEPIFPLQKDKGSAAKAGVFRLRDYRVLYWCCFLLGALRRATSWPTNTMASPDACWHVLYTKPRNEKKVAERLSGAGYTVYCPLQKVRRQWSDRVKVVEEPLFKGYLFIKIEEKEKGRGFYLSRHGALPVLAAASGGSSRRRNPYHPKMAWGVRSRRHRHLRY